MYFRRFLLKAKKKYPYTRFRTFLNSKIIVNNAWYYTEEQIEQLFNMRINEIIERSLNDDKQ